jgi:hypothetical protein
MKLCRFILRDVKQHQLEKNPIIVARHQATQFHCCMQIPLLPYPNKQWCVSLRLTAYLKGLTLPRDLRQRGTFGGPYKKKKKRLTACLTRTLLPV